jgi:Uma2 family endonuclease
LAPPSVRIESDRQAAYPGEPEIAVTEPLPKPWTVEDFLEWEAQQPERYEFIDGRILGMVGGSAAHATIKGNVFATLRTRLQGRPGRVFVESLKVVTDVASHYPDVVVTCSPVQPSDDQIREPIVVVEVLSRTTADRDRSAKWVGYQDIPSLQHYVLVAQGNRRAELFTRAADGWHLRIIRPPRGKVELSAIGVELTLDEIYEDSGA